METITTYGVGPDQPTYNQLREQNRVLREALQPFAKVAEAIDGQVWVQYLWVQSRTNPKENICISADHVRAAKAALTATSQSAQEQCSYCKRPLTDNHSFSYGVPGVPRVYKCDRADCTKPATRQEATS